MSRQLVKFILGPLINTYSWTTLPFYAVAQRPWQRLKLSKNFGLSSIKDKQGRVVYSRNWGGNHFHHPLLQRKSFNECVPLLQRNRKVIGVRDVLQEVLQLDEHGKPIKIDGRELKKITLDNKYRWLSVGEVMDRVDALARGFHQLGIKQGDKVLLYAENSLEWFCTSLALQRVNAVAVTLMSILNNEGLIYSINQCEAKYLVTSQDLLCKKINSICDSINPLSIVYIEDKFAPYSESLVSTIKNLQKRRFTLATFGAILEKGSKIAPYDFAIPNPEDTTLIMYTSGTTGNQPKGVMISHKNLMAGIYSLLRYDAESQARLLDSRFAAYLPMSHVFGFMLNMGLFLDKGEIALCSPLTMLDSSPAHIPGQIGDIRLIQPTYMAAVPLVLDRIMKEIYRKLNSRGPLAALLFTYLMEYKIRWRSRGFDTPIINRLVCKKINEQFGGKLKIITVGSAPLNERTHAMVQAALNIRCIQGYGTTEQIAGGSIMHNDDLTYGACGVPFHGSRFYLKDWPEGGYFTTDKPNPRGELVFGGDLITKGYYKMPEESEEVFKVDADGSRWCESGDIGEVLPNGTLKIIDRKKDLVKLANGEFVSLGKIESALRASAYVENICICTNPHSNSVTAIVCPSRKSMPELAKQLSKQDLSFETLCDDHQVINHIFANLKATGETMGLVAKEIPVAIYLAKEEWTQDNNLLTAAMKLKRKQVNELYKKQIDDMFARNVFNDS